MITFLNKSYRNLSIFSLISLLFSTNLYVSSLAMEKNSQQKADPGNVITSGLNWLSSAASTFCATKTKTLGFVEKYPEAIELLDKVVRKEVSIDVHLSPDQPLVYYVIMKGTAQTLAYFLENGVQLDENAIAFLSSISYLFPRSQIDPRTQRIEKLRLLIRAGFDVNHTDDAKTALGSIFSFPYWDRSYFPHTNFVYHCNFANLLLNAGANPNLPSVRGTSFSELLEAIAHSVVRPAFGDEKKIYIYLCKKLKDYLEHNAVEKERLIVRAFLACGADYNKVTEECKRKLQLSKPYIISLITNFETDKAALFTAIEAKDYAAIKALALRLPFKIKNAEGNSPLHHAVLKLIGANPNNKGEIDEATQKSRNIIVLLLRVLPQLITFENNDKQPPITLLFPKSKFWMLQVCFIPIADPLHPKIEKPCS